MTAKVSSIFKSEVVKGNVNVTSDVFKLVLLGSSYSFDDESHQKYADISSWEITEGNGYPSGGITVTGTVSVTTDYGEGKVNVVFPNVSITASGGSIGPFKHLILYNNTHTNKILVGCVSLSDPITVVDGGSYSVRYLEVQFA